MTIANILFIKQAAKPFPQTCCKDKKGDFDKPDNDADLLKCFNNRDTEAYKEVIFIKKL